MEERRQREAEREQHRRDALAAAKRLEQERREVSGGDRRRAHGRENKYVNVFRGLRSSGCKWLSSLQPDNSFIFNPPFDKCIELVCLQEIEREMETVEEKQRRLKEERFVSSFKLNLNGAEGVPKYLHEQHLRYIYILYRN